MNPFDEAFDGIAQLIEVASQIQATSKHRKDYVPIYHLWEMKIEAYKEMANLLAMIQKKQQPYQTEWQWEEE